MLIYVFDSGQGHQGIYSITKPTRMTQNGLGGPGLLDHLVGTHKDRAWHG